MGVSTSPGAPGLQATLSGCRSRSVRARIGGCGSSSWVGRSSSAGATSSARSRTDTTSRCSTGAARGRSCSATSSRSGAIATSRSSCSRVGRWDVVFDPSCYLPRHARMAASALVDPPSTTRSSRACPPTRTRPRLDQDERAPLAELADPSTEDVHEHYGALKVASERAIQRAFGDRALVLRPGLHRRPLRPGGADAVVAPSAGEGRRGARARGTGRPGPGDRRARHRGVRARARRAT